MGKAGKEVEAGRAMGFGGHSSVRQGVSVLGQLTRNVARGPWEATRGPTQTHIDSGQGG